MKLFTHRLRKPVAPIRYCRISGMLESLSGGNTTVQSLVSSKNTDVSSVQFVIKTEAIEIAEPEKVAPEPPEKLNFWQKLLRLFRLY